MSIAIARPQRTIRQGRIRRTLVGVVASAVASAGLSFAATPAQAAPTGTVTAGTATWAFNTAYSTASPGMPKPLASAYTAPATYDDATKASSWGAGTGTVAANGSATLAFSGSTLQFAPTGGAWLRLTDPSVTVDSSGNGSVEALVSYGTTTLGTPGNRTYDPTAAPLRPAERVKVANLVGNTAADATITRTAASWTGLEAAWAPEFITYVNADPTGTPPIPKYGYNTTITDDAAYAPLPFSFSVTTEPATITSAVATTNADAVSVAVSGTGYRPGQPGIYIAVLTSGRTNAELSNAAEYLGVIWSASPGNPTSAVKDDGSFATTLTIPANAIAGVDRNKSYSVYTVKAHGQNATDASQTAEAPVAINFSGFPKTVTTPKATAPASTFGDASTVTVDVPTVGAFAPTGSVTLTGAGTQTASVKDGKATFTLPRTLPAGPTALTATYSGDGNYDAKAGSITTTVTPAKVSVKRGTTAKPTTKKTGKSSLTLKSSTGAAVDGKVTVTFTKKGQKTKVKTVTIKAGKGNITIPKLARGKWTVSVKYAGTANFVKTATLKRGSFTVIK